MPRSTGILIAILLSVGTTVPSLRAAPAATSSVNVDSSGWTIFTLGANSRTVYVSSSSGSDSKHGFSPNAPVASIAKGLSLLRQGSADWLLLKKGDTWRGQQFGVLPIHGRSASEPILISTFGTGARPLIETNGSVAVGSLGNNQNGDFIALVGIEFYAYLRDPNNPNFSAAALARQQAGFQFLNKINWFLMEDCKFSFYDGNAIQYPNVDTGGMSKNVILRRNVFENSYNSNGGHSQGLYVDNVANLVLEGNLFDHNGWNSSVAGANPTVFNHDLYIQTTSGPATLIDNIFANASSHGAQVRNGGIVSDNLFVHDPIELLIGGTASAVSDNVFTDSNDIDSLNPRGYAIDVNPSKGPIQIHRNIIVRGAGSSDGHGILFAAGTVGNAATHNIIYGWKNPIVDNGIANVTSPNSIDLRDYPDAERSVERYNVSIGGKPTLSDFLAEARKQSRDNWRPSYTARAVNEYIRAGFGTDLHDQPSAKAR